MVSPAAVLGQLEDGTDASPTQQDVVTGQVQPKSVESWFGAIAEIPVNHVELERAGDELILRIEVDVIPMEGECVRLFEYDYVGTAPAPMGPPPGGRITFIGRDQLDVTNTGGHCEGILDHNTDLFRVDWDKTDHQAYAAIGEDGAATGRFEGFDWTIEEASALLTPIIDNPCAAPDPMITGVFETVCRLDIVSAPGETLALTRADLPAWARDLLVTVGAHVICVGPPARVSSGDPNVTLDGRPIARIGDATSRGGRIVSGSQLIFINLQPAAIVGSFQVCPFVTGLVPHVGGAVLGDPHHHLPAAGALRSRAHRGSTVLDIEAAAIEVGDHILMEGLQGSELGLVRDKGSIILDRPLRFDYASGTTVFAVPAEFEAIIATIYAANATEAPPA